MSRVAVFIDGSNFYHLCKTNLGRTDVNLGEFAASLVGPDRDLVRTYYYNCPLPADTPEAMRRKQEKFFGALSRTPYFEVRLGRLAQKTVKCPGCGAETQRWTEKGVDMHIGVDMLSLSSKNLIDVAVLVSGDADLSDAVKAVKELGKHVELATLPIGRSWELVQACDVVHELDPASMAPYFIKS